MTQTRTALYTRCTLLTKRTLQSATASESTMADQLQQQQPHLDDTKHWQAGERLRARFQILICSSQTQNLSTGAHLLDGWITAPPTRDMTGGWCQTRPRILLRMLLTQCRVPILTMAEVPLSVLWRGGQMN